MWIITGSLIALTSQTNLGNAHVKRVGYLSNSYISSGRNTIRPDELVYRLDELVYRPGNMLIRPDKLVFCPDKLLYQLG